MKQKILDSITKVFRDVFDDPSLVVTSESSPENIESWDSLKHLALVVEIETLTGFSLSTDEIVGVQTVGDFVDLLAKKGYRG